MSSALYQGMSSQGSNDIYWMPDDALNKCELVTDVSRGGLDDHPALMHSPQSPLSRGGIRIADPV